MGDGGETDEADGDSVDSMGEELTAQLTPVDYTGAFAKAMADSQMREQEIWDRAAVESRRQKKAGLSKSVRKVMCIAIEVKHDGF